MLQLLQRREVERGYIEGTAVRKECALFLSLRSKTPPPNKIKWSKESNKLQRSRIVTPWYNSIHHQNQLDTLSIYIKLYCYTKNSKPIDISPMCPCIQTHMRMCSIKHCDMVQWKWMEIETRFLHSTVFQELGQAE